MLSKNSFFKNYCILIDVFLPGAISLSNSMFSLFQMCFSQHSAAEFYFLFLFLLTTSPAFKRLGDTCSTCWNGCCLYRDQNNWKPDKYLTKEVLLSKQLPETEKSHCRWENDAWVRLTWFLTPWASTRVTWVSSALYRVGHDLQMSHWT